MGNVIQTNASSLNAQRNLTRTNIALGETFQRLSSGFRINSAKDDAAGLQIANQLTSQVRGLTVAIRNANDGLSVAQVAEGAQQEITNILQRMRELALSAANGTTADNDGSTGSAAPGQEKLALDAEFQALKAEITRISESTRFGNTQILNVTGDFSMTLQVGTTSASEDQITITIADIGGLNAIDGTITSITTQALAQSVLASIDSDITAIDTNRAALGAVQNRLSSTIANLSNVIENASAARSRLQDADYALETSNLAKNQVLQQAGLSVLSQANAQAQSVLSLLQG